MNIIYSKLSVSGLISTLETVLVTHLFVLYPFSGKEVWQELITQNKAWNSIL